MIAHAPLRIGKYGLDHKALIMLIKKYLCYKIDIVNIFCSERAVIRAGAMRRILAVLLILAVSAAGQQAVALAPGKPAGTQQAILGTNGMVAGVSIIVATIVAIAGTAWGKSGASSSTAK
jgi:hypothetical protein